MGRSGLQPGVAVHPHVSPGKALDSKYFLPRGLSAKIFFVKGPLPQKARNPYGRAAPKHKAEKANCVQMFLGGGYGLKEFWAKGMSKIRPDRDNLLRRLAAYNGLPLEMGVRTRVWGSSPQVRPHKQRQIHAPWGTLKDFFSSSPLHPCSSSSPSPPPSASASAPSFSSCSCVCILLAALYSHRFHWHQKSLPQNPS